MGNNQKNALSVLVACLAVAAAYACRMIAMQHHTAQTFSFIRALIYLAFFAVVTASWGRCVVQKQTRRCMISVGVLIVFWIFIRTVKYEFPLPPMALKACWYLYYLPMLFIPLMALLTALSIGKPETEKNSRKSVVLWLITAVLFLLVLTNDWHQLVFTFPAEIPYELRSDQAYGYGILYFVIVGWMTLCGVVTLGVICAKCKVPYSKKFIWLPTIPMAFTLAYAVVYYAGFPWLRYWFGDMPVTQSLLFVAVLEACLRCGLIASNTNYDALFKSVYAGMIITDKDYHIRFISDRAVPLPESVLRKTEQGSFRYGDTLLLQASTIRGGHTVWCQDLAELLAVKKELESTREELQDRNAILRDQYQRDAKRYKMEEQNRLLDLVQQETQKQLRQIDRLTDCYRQAVQDGADTKPILFQILVLATYVKRHKDMVLLAERISFMPMHALYAALQESCSNLELGGIACNLYLPECKDTLSVRGALFAYACFEEILESALEELEYVLVSVTRKVGGYVLSLTLDCQGDLSGALQEFPSVLKEQNEDGWNLSIPLTGGEAQ